MRYTSFKFGLVPTIFLWLIGILMALFILRAIFTSYTEGFGPLKTDVTRAPLDRTPFRLYPERADKFTPLYTTVEQSQQKYRELVANLHIEDLGSVQSEIDKLKAANDKANSDIDGYNKQLSNKKYLKSTKNSIKSKVDSAKKLINTNQAEMYRLTLDATTRINTYTNLVTEFNKELEDFYSNVRKIMAENESNKASSVPDVVSPPPPTAEVLSGPTPITVTPEKKKYNYHSKLETSLENVAPNYPNYKFKGCWTYGNDTAYPILTKTIAQNVTSMDDCVGKASNLGLSSAAYDGSNLCFGGGSEYSTNNRAKCKHTYPKGKSWLVYSTDDTNI